MKNVLDDVFGDKVLGDLCASRRLVIVPSFSVTNGHPTIFKTDHASTLSLHNRLRLSDVALASSAAPVYFPMVKLCWPDTGTNEVFCDGGIFANHPSLIAFAEALSVLNVPPKDIALLSISTPRLDLSDRLATMRKLRRGILGWMCTLPSALIDSNSTIIDELMKRIVNGFPEPKPLYVRVALNNSESLPMDLASEAATSALQHVGKEMSASSDVRSRLESFFL